MNSITRAQRLHLFIDHRDRATGRMNISLWTQVSKVLGCDKDDRDARLDFFSRSLGRRIVSSSEIGKMDDFTRLKAACLAVIRPADLDSQMRQAEMPKTNRICAIQKLVPESYWRAEAGRKFGTDDLELLTLDQLTELRNHCAARAPGLTWPKQDVVSVFAGSDAAGKMDTTADPDWNV